MNKNNGINGNKVNRNDGIVSLTNRSDNGNASNSRGKKFVNMVKEDL